MLEEPSPEAFKRYKASKWYTITRALKLRANRWYRIQVYAKPSAAGDAMTRLKKEFGKEGFEFVHHDGKLWGRYVATNNNEVTDTQGRSSAASVLKGKQDDHGDEEDRSATGGER